MRRRTSEGRPGRGGLLLAVPVMLALVPAAAAAQAAGGCPAPVAGSVHIAGAVDTPMTYDRASLAGLPQSTIETAIHGGEAQRWEGVPLRVLLDRAGVPAGGDIRGPHMRKVVVVEAGDGYSALFSLAELDDAFTDRVALLAYRVDGSALPAAEGPLRIVASGEKRGARQVRQVTCLRVVDVP